MLMTYSIARKSVICFVAYCISFYSGFCQAVDVNPVANNIVTQKVEKTKVNTATSNADTIQRVYTLKEINGSDGLLLTGANATRLLYLPVPREWILDNIMVELFIYSSSLFETPSMLTAYVNGNPITAVRLNEHYNINSAWKFTIPGDLATGNIVNLTLNNMLDNYGNNCFNLTSPKFWVYITGKSKITYNYHIEDYNPDLTKYPFPFINNPAIEKDTVIIVFPKVPTFADYTSAFYIVSSLISRSTWLGVNLIAASIDTLTEEQKNKYNLIYVGTSQELRLLDMPVKWPLLVKDKIANINSDIVADDTGVIMLARSPWNAKKAILVVTGNSDNAVIKSASMLRNTDFNTTVLFNQYALITSDVKEKEYHTNWSDISFSNLGFPTQSLYGSGQNAVNYDIELPLDKAIKGLDLSIQYSISPFISKRDSSYLTLKVNDIPVNGITLKSQNSSIQTWPVHIEGSALRNGKNRISLIFNLYNKNESCKQEDTSLVWGTIYDSSTLHLTLDSSNVFLNFNIFKGSPYNLTVYLPEEDTYFKTIDFAQQVINLRINMPSVSDIRFDSDKNFDINASQESNIIYIGDVNNEKIQPYLASIPFYFKDKKLIIDPLLKRYVSVSNELPIAINEVIRSPINPDRLIMFFITNDSQSFQDSIALYTDAKKSALIDGNAVLLYQNGTFTSIKSDKIINTAIKKKRVKNDIFYVLGAIVLVVVCFIFIRSMYKRIRRYFLPKS